MTIKLSTTNSVKKTLQHKALWDLETPCRDVGDDRGCGSEGVSGAGLDSTDGPTVPLSEIHRILYRFRGSGEQYNCFCPVL